MKVDLQKKIIWLSRYELRFLSSNVLFMLQRIQSLLLACIVITYILTLFLPLYASISTQQQLLPITLLDSRSALLIHLSPVIVALISIFQYKNRTLQIKLCRVGLVLSIITLCLTIFWSRLFIGDAPKDMYILSWGTFILFLNPILFYTASRFILRDEELVRSVDRLR